MVYRVSNNHLETVAVIKHQIKVFKLQRCCMGCSVSEGTL